MDGGFEQGSYLRLVNFVSLKSRLESNKEEEGEEEAEEEWMGVAVRDVSTQLYGPTRVPRS